MAKNIGSVGTKNNNVISTLLKSLDNEHATIAINGTAYDNKEFVDTGNLLFNAQLSGNIYCLQDIIKYDKSKKIRKESGIGNCVTFLSGDESCGKSYVLYSVIGNFLKKHTENGIVVIFESEGAANKEKLEQRNIDLERVIFAPVDTVEDFKIQITKFLDAYKQVPKEERPKVFMCLDSLGMLGSKHECDLALSGESKSDLSRAKEIKSTFRIITPKLALMQIPLVVVNHVYEMISGGYGQPAKIQSGGKGGRMSASVIVYFSKSQFKDENSEDKNAVAGIYVTSTIMKSRYTKEKTQVKFIINFNTGIDKYSGLFDFCYDKGLILKAGTRYHWHNVNEETKKFKKEIITNPEEFFTDKILDEFNEWCNNHFLLGKGNFDEDFDDNLDLVVGL